MFKNILRDFKKGFTLVELLVVIAVLGVLAAGLIVAINPQDKVFAANDSGIQNSIGQIAGALSAYATAHNGAFPCVAVGAAPCPNTVAADGAGLNALTASGELTVLPSVPATYTQYASFNAGYYADDSVTPARAKLVGELKSKKYAGAATSARWVWCSWTATATNVPASGTGAATTGTTACP